MRTQRIFDIVVAIMLAAGVAFIVLNLLYPLAWYWPATAMVGLLGLGAVYVWGFRDHVSAGLDQRPVGWYLLLVVALFLAAFGLVALMFLQVVGHVLVWATRRTVKSSILWTVAVSWLATLGAVAGANFEAKSVTMASFTNTIAMVAAIAYGMWMRHTQQIATEKTRLYDELVATQHELRRTALHAGALEERARMSRELHDTLAQSLSGLVMVAGNAKDTAPTRDLRRGLALIEQMAREALVEARSVIAELAPLQTTGDAAQSIARVVERVQRESGLVVTTRLEPTIVPRSVEMVLVRCTQEGLANVRKHAETKLARVSLHCSDGHAVLEVADNGVGPQGADDGGFGLAGMRDRVALARGTATFGSRPEGGSVLRVDVPIELVAPAQLTERSA